jgi:hypothetical protein
MGEKVKVRWEQLGRPTTAGVHRVMGIGDVQVTEENIRDAEEIGGDPWVELCDSTGFGPAVRQYTIGHFTPA